VATGKGAAGGQLVNARRRDKGGALFDFRHYLAPLEQKPDVLDFSRPLEDVELPHRTGGVRRTLGHGGAGSSSRVLACESAPPRREFIGCDQRETRHRSDGRL
jgi:hypothetical protein